MKITHIAAECYWEYATCECGGILCCTDKDFISSEHRCKDCNNIVNLPGERRYPRLIRIDPSDHNVREYEFNCNICLDKANEYLEKEDCDFDAEWLDDDIEMKPTGIIDSEDCELYKCPSCEKTKRVHSIYG